MDHGTAVDKMNIHPDIEVGNQVATAKIFQLVPVSVAVQRSENDRAFTEVGQSLLPRFLDCDYVGVGVNGKNHSLGDVHFRSAEFNITGMASNCAVVVLVLIFIHIGQDKTTDPDVG